MRRFCCAISGLILFCLHISTAHAEGQQLRFAHNGGPGSLYEACANEFARRVNAKLPAGFQVLAIGDSKTGDNIAILDQIRNGELALSLSSTAMSSLSDKFGIFELPFLIRDRAQFQKVSQVLLDQYLQPEAARKGYRILAIWENGFRHITNNVRPIRQPDDLRGLKVRIPKGPWREKIFKALGAEPVPMALHETYAALRDGRIDGEENPLQQIKGSKFSEVQRYLTLSEHVYTPAYVIVGEASFARLPPAVQQILASAAGDMQDWVYQTAIRLDSDLIDELSERMTTNQLDIKAFDTVTRPVYGEFVRTVEGGAKMLQIVTGMVDAADFR